MRRKLSIGQIVMFALLIVIGRTLSLGGWGVVHNMMTADALHGLESPYMIQLSATRVAWYSIMPDIILKSPEDSCHRIKKYQDIFERLQGEKCEHPGAEFWARIFIEEACRYASNGDLKEAEKWLGYAIHYIEDTVCPAHIFPFKEGDPLLDRSDPPWPHYHFEHQYTSSRKYERNADWRLRVRNTLPIEISSPEDLETKLQSAAADMHRFPASFTAPNKKHYSARNAEDENDYAEIEKAPSKGWDMDDHYIGLAMQRAAALVKGAALLVMSHYRPTTGLDIVLVIDRSWSMEWSSYLEPAKRAASTFIDFMEPGDMVGVVSFCEYAYENYSLTEIDPEGVQKEIAKDKIDLIGPCDWTSIGAGLLRAQKQLTNRGRSNSKHVIILLSDGYENTAPWIVEVLGDIPTRTRIYTIALGSETDQRILQDIATELKDYLFAPSSFELQALYNRIAADIAGREGLLSAGGRAYQGEEKGIGVRILNAFKTFFSLFWDGSRLDLTLKSPSGRIITPEIAASDPFITYRAGTTFQSYEINFPAPGNWVMQIKGTEVPSGGEEYIVQVTGQSDLTLDAYFGREQYFVGEPITILAWLTRKDQPLSTAIVTAEVREPWQSTSSPMQVNGDSMPASTTTLEAHQETIRLYDDGRHGDGGANDGIFGATYTPNVSGTYIFTFKAVGVVNLINRFTRTAQRAIFIPSGPPPPVWSTADQQTEIEITEVLNVPNPASRSTRFVVKGIGLQDIRIEIFDLAGRKVFDSGFIGGEEFEWSLTTNHGQQLANGPYLYIVTAEGSNGKLVRSEVGKLAILR